MQEKLLRVIRHELIAALVITASLSAGCAKKPEPATVAQDSAATDTHTEPQRDAAEEGDVVTAKFAPGGIAAKYKAHFVDGSVKRIEEVRTADERRGEYEFYGARLLKYSGAATASSATLAIEFDMQGAVQTATANPAPIADSEITAIRERASMFRSHALAQRSMRAHSPQ